MASSANFSLIFKKSFESFKKELPTITILASIFSVVTTLLEFGRDYLITKQPLGYAISGMSIGGMSIVWIAAAAIIINIIVFFKTIAFLKFSTDVTINKKSSVAQSLTYAVKNFFSFLWTSIIGTIYGLGWPLLGVLIVPIYLALQRVLVTSMTVSAMGIKVIGFLVAIIGFFSFISVIYRGVKITFTANAFVQDEKRGVEAAKSSIALVEGRWWDVVILMLGISIIMAMISFVLTFMVGFILVPLSILVPQIFITMIHTIITNILTLLGTILMCNLYNEYKKAPDSHSRAHTSTV